MTGFAAVLWLAGLLFAAPVLRSSQRYGLGDRLRDALVLGVAIVALAGIVHALYAPVLWLLLAGAAGACVVRGFPERSDEPIPVFLLAALALVAWPALLRPVLDGDSLAYHLPNAASWANAHSLYTNVTRYWWYPPASELFATGLYSVAGPFAVGWSGTLALAFAGVRIRDWYLRCAPRRTLLADLAGAAFVTMLPLAWQAGSLQNDVWLAAFAFECATAAKGRDTLKAALLTAFVKPYGALVDALALARRPKLLALPAVALVLWAVRDALLNPSAVTPFAATTGGNVFSTTIAAHFALGIATTASAFFTMAPFSGLAFLCALALPILRRDASPLGLLAVGSALLFFVLPYAYDNGVAQLASGMSLRYASVAMMCGLALAAPYAARAVTASRVAFAIAALYGAGIVVATFSNDAPTRSAVIVAGIVVVAALVARRLRSALPLAVAAAAAVFIAVPYASRTTVQYLKDATSFGLMQSNVFAYVEHFQPPQMVAVGIRGGALLLVDPTATIVDADDRNGCEIARRLGADLVVFDENGRSVAENMARLRNARRCGPALHDDPMSTVILPR